MHLNLDEFNCLIEGNCSKSERQAFANHILDCDKCSNDFKMFTELREKTLELKKEVRNPWKYALGAAAVLMLSVWPHINQTKTDEQGTFDPHIVNNAPAKQDTKSFDLMNEIEEINYKEQLSNWGTKSNIQDLLKQKRNS